jgi:hypothetical protein
MTKAEFKQGAFRMGRCLVLVTIDGGKYHLSISTEKEIPTYEELKQARYQFIPDDAFMAQIFPPKSDFVNAHPYCLHLFEVEPMN